MRTPTPTILAIIGLGAGVLTTAATAQDRWTQAASQIARLQPTEFPDVPLSVQNHLVELGCTIPQAWGNTEPHNIASGEFAHAGQTDWAALCSRGGESEIVVIWGGSVSCPSPLARMPDRDYLQEMARDGILFSRGIGAAAGDLLQRYWMYADRGDPPNPVHEAITDAFYEKGATAYYCHEGRWVRYTSD